MPSVSDIGRNPDEVTTTTRVRQPIPSTWVPPDLGFIKINIDGSFSAEVDRNGISGIFRDHTGNTLLQFNKEILSDSAISAKISAIRDGLLIAAASRWSNSSYFMLESDSTNVVAWFKDLSQAPWKFTNIIRECLQWFGSQITWSISRIQRTGNDAADVLARVGAQGMSFVEFV